MRRFALPFSVFALAACNVSTTNTLGSGSTHDGGTVVSDETWAAGTHTVDGNITIQGAKVTIEAGTVVTMTAGSTIIIGTGGSLAVLGTSSARITFTSDHAAAGDWDGIYVQGDASNTSIIQNANIAFAGKSRAAVTVASGGTLTLNNTRIEQSNDYGLQLFGRAYLAGFAGNAFVNNALGPAAVDADSAEQLKASIYTPNAIEGVLVEATTLGHSAFWSDLGVAYVTDDLTISAANGNATLTLNANVIVQFISGKSWDVSTNGALVANGTPAHPVIFSSSEADPAPGDWGAIKFERDSAAAINKLTSAIVEYGGGDAFAGGEIWLAPMAQVAIDHSLIQLSGSMGVNALTSDATTSANPSDGAYDGGKLPNFASNQVTRNTDAGVALTADAVDGLEASSTYSGNGALGVLVASGNVSHAATWHDLGVPYVLQGQDFSIGGFTGTSATTALTLDPGCELQFDTAAVLTVRKYGQLVANGSSAAHVKFTAKSVSLGWREIDFFDSASVLDFTDFEYGGIGGYGQIWVANNASVSLSDITFMGLDTISSCNINLNGNATVTAYSSDSCQAAP